MRIREIKDSLRNEVNNWTATTSLQDKKRLFPYFFASDNKIIWKYFVALILFYIFINITSVCFKAFYNLCIQTPSALENTDNLIGTIIAIILIATILLIIIVISSFISILCYDKNVVKNEKLTKILFAYLIIQALINSNFVNSEIISIMGIGLF